MIVPVLVQSTLNISIKLEALRAWVHENRDIAGTYAQIIDLRREPMYRAGEISRSFLREEIIGRLVILRARHQSAGRSVPHSEDIDAAMTHLAGKGSPLGWAMPGPLDGHRRPADQNGRALSEADVSGIVEELSKDPHGAIWSKLAYFSQCFDLGEKVLEQACRASVTANFDHELVEGKERPSQLFDVCLIAASHRSKELANSIATIAIKRAPSAITSEAAMALLQIILLAGAAFENEEEWTTWTTDHLDRLANNLPVGKATKTFYEHLVEVRKSLALPFCGDFSR